MANLKNFGDAKDWIMSKTRDDLALLASDLGYAWTQGTNGQFPGDNMLLDGDRWIPDMTGPKLEPKGSERLIIQYGDWKLKIKDIKFEEAKIEQMEPYIAKFGNIINDEPTPVTKTVNESIEFTRSVTNTNETSFSAGASIGASFTYSPPAGIGGSTNYKVGLEDSKAEATTKGEDTVSTLTVESSKPVEKYSAIQWQMMISRMKATSQYTAKVAVSFSAEFQGFLRWGGAQGLYKNFHKDYSGSDARPTIKYKFGSDTKSFAEDLKDQSSNNKAPWLWSQMKERYVHNAELINRLSDVTNYEFEVAGRIDDIKGLSARVRWKEIPFPGSEDAA